MPLPHFHTLPIVQEPIWKFSYDFTMIYQDKYDSIRVEKFEIVNDMMTCKIQHDVKIKYQDIKNSNILLIDYHDKKGHKVRTDVISVDNIEYKVNFDWNETDMSYIDTIFKIKSIRTLVDNELINTDSLAKSIIREQKINILLD